jgi:DNA mismatch endonuclease, patch repair protein
MEHALRKHLPGGGFAGVTEQRSKAMAAVRGKGNKTTEQLLRFRMVRAGICGWVMHPAEIPGKPDFFFCDAKLVVFLDGCFWHGCAKCGHLPKTHASFWRAKIERNRARDIANRKLLKRKGFRVFRFWEHDLQQNAIRCIEKIRAVVCEGPCAHAD